MIFCFFLEFRFKARIRAMLSFLAQSIISIPAVISVPTATLLLSNLLGNTILPVYYNKNTTEETWKNKEKDEVAQNIYKLFDPEDPQVDVIFIHGIDGHPYDTTIQMKYFLKELLQNI